MYLKFKNNYIKKTALHIYNYNYFCIMETITPYDDNIQNILNEVHNYQHQYHNSLTPRSLINDTIISPSVEPSSTIDHPNPFANTSSISSSKKRAFVTLTYAQSIDGSIATGKGYQTSISCPESLRMTHDLRTIHEGILIGIGTLLADNPSLTARLATPRKRQIYDSINPTIIIKEELVSIAHPQPIILDPYFAIPLTCKLLNDIRCRKPIIIILQSYYDKHIDKQQDIDIYTKYKTIIDKGARIYSVPAFPTVSPLPDSSPKEMVDLYTTMELLYEKEQLYNVMVEGGANILSHYFYQHSVGTSSSSSSSSSIIEKYNTPLIHCILITIAPILIPGGLRIPYPTISNTTINNNTSSSSAPIFSLAASKWLPVGKDMIIVGHL